MPPAGIYPVAGASPEVNAYRLYRRAIRYNISIAPGRCLAPMVLFNYIRLSYGSAFSEEIERSLMVLGELVKGQGINDKLCRIKGLKWIIGLFFGIK